MAFDLQGFFFGSPQGGYIEKGSYVLLTDKCTGILGMTVLLVELLSRI
jgi:hypothetical protein